MQTSTATPPHQLIGLCSRRMMGVIVKKHLHNLQAIQKSTAIIVIKTKQEENLWQNREE